MISKVYLPKYILIFNRILVNGFKMMVSFVLVVIMMLIYRVPVSLNVFYIIPILVDLTLFTCTLGGATRVTVRCVMTGSEAAEWTSIAKEDLSEKIGEIQKQSETSSS